jgi:hypothetical protein
MNKFPMRTRPLAVRWGPTSQPPESTVSGVFGMLALRCVVLLTEAPSTMHGLEE